jgi:hypothetical protein
MKSFCSKRIPILISIFAGVVFMLATMRSSYAISLPECVTNSQNAGNLIRSAPCGTFGVVFTRQEAGLGDVLDVSVKYMVHAPAGAPKALIMLFSGGAGDSGIEGDEATGVVTAAGNNFLVRGAQLFAEDGFLTVTIDRPSTGPAANPAYDQYRVSPRHAHDIVAVLADVEVLLAEMNYPFSTAPLNLFLVGTSRGAISVVAQNNLGSASLLSSPVTVSNQAGTSLWVGADSNHPRLLPSFVKVPAHVLAHAQDGCSVSPAALSKQLQEDLRGAGVNAFFNGVNGGFEINPDPCQATTFHGYLGIERTAVSKITKRADYFLKKMTKKKSANIKPAAENGEFATASNTALAIDLAFLTSDQNGDSLSYFLPHPTSSRGGQLSLNGSVATYTPPVGGSNLTDGFVYQVSDGKGGKSNGLISVRVN